MSDWTYSLHVKGKEIEGSIGGLLKSDLSDWVVKYISFTEVEIQKKVWMKRMNF